MVVDGRELQVRARNALRVSPKMVPWISLRGSIPPSGARCDDELGAFGRSRRSLCPRRIPAQQARGDRASHCGRFAVNVRGSITQIWTGVWDSSKVPPGMEAAILPEDFDCDITFVDLLRLCRCPMLVEQKFSPLCGWAHFRLADVIPPIFRC